MESERIKRAESWHRINVEVEARAFLRLQELATKKRKL